MELFTSKPTQRKLDEMAKQLSSLSASCLKKQQELIALEKTYAKKETAIKEAYDQAEKEYTIKTNKLRSEVETLEARRKEALEPLDELEKQLAERSQLVSEKEKELSEAYTAFRNTHNEMERRKRKLEEEERKLAERREQLELDIEDTEHEIEAMKKTALLSVQTATMLQTMLEERLKDVQKREELVEQEARSNKKQQASLANIANELDKKKQALNKKAYKLREYENRRKQ